MGSSAVLGAAVDHRTRVSYRVGHGVAPHDLLGRFISLFYLQLRRSVRIRHERVRAGVQEGIQPAQDIRHQPDR
jgi:hypothetical protein